MPRRRKLIYLLADGAHARFVEHVPETHAYVTVSRMSGEERLATLRVEQRDEPAGRSFESASSARHGVGREDAYLRAKQAFAGDVAHALNDQTAKRELDGVVLVAPPRLLKVLREGLTPTVPILGELGKDLTKTADHELGEWLDPFAFAHPA
jgi:protein required for attachment to host cells